MNYPLTFILGIILGANVGLVLAAMLAAAGRK